MWGNKLMRRFIVITVIFMSIGLLGAGLFFINKVDAQQEATVPVPASKTDNVPLVETEASKPDAVTSIDVESWILSCRDIVGESDKKQCSASNRIVNQESGQVLFVWLVGKNTEEKLVSTFQTPTGIFIAPGLELQLNGPDVHKVDYTACDAQRCVANILMNDKFVAELKNTKELSAKIISVTGHNILFKIDTAGIEEVLATIMP